MGDVQSDNTDWLDLDLPDPAVDTAVVAVTLSETEKRVLAERYIANTMYPESLETFFVALNEGKTLEHAIAHAVLNDACNDVLAVAMFEADMKDLSSSVPAQPSKMIWVTFRKEGVHRYPAAATDPKLKTGAWDDVSFLGVEHRHIFHFRVSMEVFHDDRDVEFIQFKRWLERLYNEGTLELNHKSCEMISDDLCAMIRTRFPGRKLIIEVSEDGENGSTAEYLP